MKILTVVVRHQQGGEVFWGEISKIGIEDAFSYGATISDAMAKKSHSWIQCINLV